MPMKWAHLEQEHPLGKGEVVSSILPGSTRKPYDPWGFDSIGNRTVVAIAQNEARNAQLHPCKIRGI